MSIDRDDHEPRDDSLSLSSSAYAELLSNLAQLSISIVLPTPANATSIARIANDSTLHISHGGTTSSLRLPVSLSSVNLPLKRGSTSQRYRLPLSSTLSPAQDTGIVVPWSAPDLTEKSVFGCKSCSATILGPLSIWRDLPSENWAEMMDFWHCHKPPPETKVEEEPKTKAYGFNNRIEAIEGVGFVDLLHFLAWPEDCHNISVTKGSSILSCQGCTAPLGLRDRRRDGYKLFKSSLAKKDRDESFGISPFLAALLSQQISLVGTRFFTVVRDNYYYEENDESEATDGGAQASNGTTNGVDETESGRKRGSKETHEQGERVKLWITAPATTYSVLSSTACIENKRAMKILFKLIPSPPNVTSSVEIESATEHVTHSQGATSTTNGNSDNGETHHPAGESHDHRTAPGGFLSEDEEIPLPPHLYASFLNSLRSSTSKLPDEVSSFEDWQVALLDRF